MATFICSRMRFERTEMQARRESRKIELPHPWTDAQLAAIEEDVLAEQPRGAEPRPRVRGCHAVAIRFVAAAAASGPREAGPRHGARPGLRPCSGFGEPAP